MQRSALTGTRIRERRTMLGFKQADLARQAGISASYLNLIEHNRRRIGGKLLNRIAASLSVEPAALAQGAESGQIDMLGETAASMPEVATELDRIDEFVGRFPGWAAAIAAQQRKLARLEQRVATLAERLEHDPFLSSALHDLLTKASAIQSTASILHETDDLDEAWSRRFHRNLVEDSAKLADGASRLAAYLDSEGEVELGLVSPQEELESFLNRTGFHLAGLEGAVPDLIETMIAEDPALQSPASRDLARAHLAQYRADALAMPLAAFAAAADAARFDPARLAAQFGVTSGAAFRRLASLPAARPSQALGLVVCDGSGALTLRKATDLLAMPRFGAACPLWPLFQALAQPATPIRVVLAHASRPDLRVTAFAISEARFPLGFDGPPIREATMILIPPGLADPAVEAGRVQVVGSTCRVCPATSCPARREPSILSDGFDMTTQRTP